MLVKIVVIPHPLIWISTQQWLKTDGGTLKSVRLNAHQNFGTYYFKKNILHVTCFPLSWLLMLAAYKQYVILFSGHHLDVLNTTQSLSAESLPTILMPMEKLILLTQSKIIHHSFKGWSRHEFIYKEINQKVASRWIKQEDGH